LTPEGLYVIFERILNEEYQLTKINRVFIDCRDLPNEIDCTLMISGSMKEVLKIALRHALLDHGHKDTQELRKQLRTMLKPESKKNFIKKKGITK
jgi:hypothetical protein